MAKVSKKIKDKIVDVINNLDNNIKDKCSLCNITLTDVVKKVEVSTKAPTRTVCDVIAEVINEGRPEYEYISGKALYCKVRRTEGKDSLKKYQTGNSVTSSKKLKFIDIRYQTDDDKEIIKLNNMVSAMIEVDKANQRQAADFNHLMKDFEKAYNMLSPVQKQQFEDKL